MRYRGYLGGMKKAIKGKTVFSGSYIFCAS